LPYSALPIKLAWLIWFVPLVETYQFQLISSGGTAKVLAAADLPVTKVSDYTGAPEILGGRVKTLHPKVHGGILARVELEQDHQDLQANQIQPIALVVVNLYPFEQTIAKEMFLSTRRSNRLILVVLH
jgi:phosphoribosylaminoimidazolecarboxamide formyltransferase/IMP cyclohydrolase